MSFYAECDECEWHKHGASPSDLRAHEDECGDDE